MLSFLYKLAGLVVTINENVSNITLKICIWLHLKVYAHYMNSDMVVGQQATILRGASFKAIEWIFSNSLVVTITSPSL